MNYTIASLTQHCTDNPLTLDIEISGNKYVVWLSNANHERTSKKFDSLKDAYKVFEKLSSWLIFHYYTEEQQRKFLETGTMD